MMITTDIGGLDKDYYYQVDGVKTPSRNHALLLAGGDLSRIKFYYLDDVWDRIDWSVEPQSSINQLCEQRCRQLREQYDWLCVWLSAGYDSQTILDSFIRAGVKIDEIAYMHRLEYYQDPEVPFIIQTANDYKTYHNPNVRIFQAEVDSDYTFDVYRKLKERWVLEPGSALRFSKSISPFVHRFHDDVVKLRLSTRGRRADIYGKEKPRLTIYNGWWHMMVTDSIVDDVIGAGVVPFFTTPDLPEIHVKQCYLAMAWFESLEGLTNDLVHGIQGADDLLTKHKKGSENSYYRRWNLALGRVEIGCPEAAHALTKKYFTHDENSFDSMKLLNHVKTERSKIVNDYAGGTLELTRVLDNKELKTPILSKSWPIRPVKIQ